jgi:beta-glucanase (GH16 family)
MKFFHPKLIASCLSALALMGGSASRGEGGGYQLVFADEFDLPALDSTKWITTMGFIGRTGARYHNDSYLSYATDEDVILEDRKLRLRADRRTIAGEDPMGEFKFTQGFVSTHGHFSFTYGYIEVRARMPRGKGIWPTIWLMPEDSKKWPPEFDIVEYYAGRELVRFGLATGTMTDVKWDEMTFTNPAVEDDWHTYGLIWEAGHAVWLLDGAVKLEVWGDHVPAAPMYLILNNGVSSRVGPSGEPDETTVFPNFLEVDYVRVYQRPEAVEKPAP